MSGFRANAFNDGATRSACCPVEITIARHGHRRCLAWSITGASLIASGRVPTTNAMLAVVANIRISFAPVAKFSRLAESGALESLDYAFVAILGLNDARENFGVLRICFCLSHYYPIASGAERQAQLQAKELIRRGHRVQVVTRAIAHLPEVEEVEGVTVHRTIRPRELGPIFGLTFVTTLCGALKKMRADYDLIHCHQGLWEAVAAGRVGPKLKKPSLVQPAAGGEYGEIRQWARTRGRGLLRK